MQNIYSFHKYILNMQWEYKGKKKKKDDKFTVPALAEFIKYIGVKNFDPRIILVNIKK